MKLMIVESPNKIGKISQILGDDWTVRASVGHVRDLPNTRLGITENYKLEYKFSERGEDICRRLKLDVSQAKEVYLATDPDREGEAIAWHLSETLALKNPHRVTFAEITTEAIHEAVNHPRKINQELVKAQEARRALDRLVGFKVSSKLSDYAGKKLNAGRVQSPTLRLVVDRERSIKSFIPKEHYSITAQFEGWSATYDTGDEFLTDKSEAERIASEREFRIVAVENERKIDEPPAPFITSTLLQAANSDLKLRLADAMNAAQKLFEGGHITYHRTDFPNLSENAVSIVRDLAETKGWPLPETSRRFRVKANAQEAHEAIRPTHFENETAGSSENEKLLYELIWKRAVSSQLAACEADKQTIILDVNGSRFIASSSVIIESGWKGTFGAPEKQSSTLPTLTEGEVVNAVSVDIKPLKTRPAKRFSAASLLRKMEETGIGRPSTYSSIISGLIKNLYLEENEGFLLPSVEAENVIDVLVGRFDFVELAFTKNLEEKLDDIEGGKTEYFDIVSEADTILNEQLLTISSVRYPCPSCGSAMLRLFGEKSQRHFWACKAQGCDTRCSDNEGNLGAIIEKNLKPSEKQIEFATKIANEEGVELPSFEIAQDLSNWINAALEKKKAARPFVGASEKQINLIKKLVTDKKIKAPSGFPEKISASTASDFISKHLKKTGK